MIRTQPPSFGHLLAETLERHGISLSAAAHMLGYKSKTTAHRILNDQTNYDTIERFYHALLEKEFCSFSQAEKNALEKALDMRRVGAEASNANAAMWSFMQAPSAEGRDIPAMGHFLGETFGTMPLSEVMKIYLSAKRMRLIIINSKGILPLFAACLREAPSANIEIDHYVFVNDDALRTVEYMSSTLLMMHDARYRSYSVCSDDLKDRSGGILGGDWVIADVEKQDGSRVRWQGAILPEMLHALPMSAECDLFSFWKRIVDAYMPATRPAHVMHPLETIEDYVRLVTDAMEMENGRSVYHYKGDMGFDFVPIDLQRAAALEGCAQAGMNISDAAVTGAIDRLYAIQKKRYENLVGKKKSTHCVTSVDSLRRFAMTGIHSDHPFFMRPYTIAERRRILAHICERLQEDPYFEIHLLRGDVPVPGLNLCCYEGEGIIFTHIKDDGSKDAAPGELIVMQQQFVQTMHDFFRREILTRCVMPTEKTPELLQELIRELDEAAE